MSGWRNMRVAGNGDQVGNVIAAAIRLAMRDKKLPLRRCERCGLSNL
jgi:hypothetical protein